MIRRGAAALLLAAGLLGGLAAEGGAQGDGLERLWREYPLRDGAPASDGASGSGAPGARPEAGPGSEAPRGSTAGDADGAGAADGGAGVPVGGIVGGGVVVLLLGLVAGRIAIGRRRDRAPAPVTIDEPDCLSWAAGETIRGEPGSFEGPVSYDGAELVLVEDVERGPIWVWRSELRETRRPAPAR